MNGSEPPSSKAERQSVVAVSTRETRGAPTTAVAARSDIARYIDARGQAVSLDFERLAAAGLTYGVKEAPQKRNEYRRICRHLFLSISDGANEVTPEGRVVAITSAMPGEGKSYSCLNIARSIAEQFGQSVLLVDADITNATLSQALGVAHHPGVTDFLCRIVSDLPSVVKPTSEPRVAFLPVGTQRRDVHQILVEARLQLFAARLAEVANGGIVLLDCGSALRTEDASQVAAAADRVVLVVRAGATLVDAVREAIDQIDVGSRLMLLLNAWQPVRPSERDYSGR